MCGKTYRRPTTGRTVCLSARGGDSQSLDKELTYQEEIQIRDYYSFTLKGANRSFDQAAITCKGMEVLHFFKT